MEQTVKELTHNIIKSGPAMTDEEYKKLIQYAMRKNDRLALLIRSMKSCLVAPNIRPIKEVATAKFLAYNSCAGFVEAAARLSGLMYPYYNADDAVEQYMKEFDVNKLFLNGDELVATLCSAQIKFNWEYINKRIQEIANEHHWRTVSTADKNNLSFQDLDRDAVVMGKRTGDIQTTYYQILKVKYCDFKLERIYIK